MTAHDPLCPVYGLHEHPRFCTCVALAARDERTRADERERIAQALEEFADDWADWSAIVQAGDDIVELRDAVKSAIHDAAAIARGEQ